MNKAVMIFFVLIGSLSGTFSFFAMDKTEYENFIALMEYNGYKGFEKRSKKANEYADEIYEVVDFLNNKKRKLWLKNKKVFWDEFGCDPSLDQFSYGILFPFKVYEQNAVCVFPKSVPGQGFKKPKKINSNVSIFSTILPYLGITASAGVVSLLIYKIYKKYFGKKIIAAKDSQEIVDSSIDNDAKQTSNIDIDKIGVA